jgi:hypothetical protein
VNGFRVEGTTSGISGVFNEVGWADDSHLLLTWTFYIQSGPDYGVYPRATYLIDTAAARISMLPVSGIGRVVPQHDGKKVVLLPAFGAPLSVAVLDLASSQVETIISADPVVPQWLSGTERQEVLNWFLGTSTVIWLDTDTFVLNFNSGDKFSFIHPGKIVLVQLQSHKIRMLTDQGQAVAALPDGSLLLRSGWVDGPVVVLTPPYDGQSTEVTTSGPWTDGWAVSPDGRRVAWFDLEGVLVPGDPDYLPDFLPSSYPKPEAKNLIIWDRMTNQTQRYWVKGVRWPYDNLHWRKDSKAVLFAGTAQDTPEHIALIQMDLTGQSAILADYTWPGTIQVHAEGKDGSLYYTVGPEPFGHPPRGRTEFAHRYPDGVIIVLPTQGWKSQYLEEADLLVTYEGSTRLNILDLTNGTIRSIDVKGSAEVSPNGRWVAHNAWSEPVSIVSIK